jgi:hypothetical protein
VFPFSFPFIVCSGADAAEFLVLEGRPIGEPVVQHGPFVMNTKDQIMQVQKSLGVFTCHLAVCALKSPLLCV